MSAPKWWWYRRGRSSWARRRTRKIVATPKAPSTKVTIAKPFAVGKFEVTVAQFEAFVRASGHDAGERLLDPETRRRQMEVTRDRELPQSGLLPRKRSPGGLRQLGGCEGLCGVALGKDRQGLPVALGSGVGNTRPGQGRTTRFSFWQTTCRTFAIMPMALTAP